MILNDDYRIDYTDPDVLERIWKSPWDGDEDTKIPRSYPLWYWYYRKGQEYRHSRGLHTYHQRPLHEATGPHYEIYFYCSWCGKSQYGSDHMRFYRA